MANDGSRYTRDPMLRTFGAVLRAYRDARGLSRPQLAEALGCKPRWIEKLETAEKPPSEATAEDLDVYFNTGPARTFWTMWREIKREGKHAILPPGFSGFVDREAEAAVMYVFEAMAITGLFQTPEYAYEVLREGRKPEEVEELVAKRVERQEILAREDPPQIVAVFDEAAIRRVVGDAEVMRGQIRRLVEIAKMPNVTMQFVASTKGAYAGIMGAFTILGREDGSSVAYTEGHVGGRLVDNRATVHKYALRFDLIRGAAMPADESLRLLHCLLESL
jgi:transcriptional regulator with XRE-family HTH domain